MGPAPHSHWVQIWSLPVRLAHGGLAALVLFNLLNDGGGRVHRYAGYAAVAIVVSRLLYGFLLRGAHWAKPHLPSPRAVWNHARLMFARTPPRLPGHNPLGAWMSVMLWVLVLLLGLTGWVSRTDRFWGEDWPVDLHEAIGVALQICVLLHWAGVALSSALERRNLAASMLHGGKLVDRDP